MIRNFLRRLMVGRYGPDNLGTAMLISAAVLGVLFALFRIPYITYLGDLLLIIAMFRLMSRNIPARRRENDRYLRFWGPIRSRIRRRTAAFRDRRTYKYFTCPACRNTLRVPKGRGKLQVTCPRCGERFFKKS